MADPTSTAAGVGAGVAVTAVGGWLLKALAKREVARLDRTLEQHGRDIEELKTTAARQSDVTALRNEIREYNRERAEEARELRARIDELFRRMPSR